MGQALPFIGMGLTAGSSILSGIQQQQYTEAQIAAEKKAYQASHAARMAEVARQAGYQKTADADMANVYGTSSAATNATNRGQAVTDFQNLYDSRGTTQPEGQLLSGQDQTTDFIKDEIAKRAATSAQDTRERVKALARIGSFDTAMNKSGLALQNNSDLLNTLGGMRRGSLAVNGMEAGVPAAQVMPGNNLLSPIMSAAGGFVSGMSGTPGGFGGFTVDGSGGYHPNYGIFNGLVAPGSSNYNPAPYGDWVGNI